MVPTVYEKSNLITSGYFDQNDERVHMSSAYVIGFITYKSII